MAALTAITSDSDGWGTLVLSLRAGQTRQPIRPRQTVIDRKRQACFIGVSPQALFRKHVLLDSISNRQTPQDVPSHKFTWNLTFRASGGPALDHSPFTGTPERGRFHVRTLRRASVRPSATRPPCPLCRDIARSHESQRGESTISVPSLPNHTIISQKLCFTPLLLLLLLLLLLPSCMLLLWSRMGIIPPCTSWHHGPQSNPGLRFPTKYRSFRMKNPTYLRSATTYCTSVARFYPLTKSPQLCSVCWCLFTGTYQPLTSYNKHIHT